MTAIRCPHCGSPARVRGRRWECGWCGDFGMLRPRPAPQTTETAPEPPEPQPPAPPRDLASLADMVRRWDFSQNEWACRDLLAAAFPTAAGKDGATTMDVLLDTEEWDPETALAMMELLLDTAGDHLQNPEAAEQLLGGDCYDLLHRPAIVDLLAERLTWDDQLARQLFQSAYVGPPQEDLLEALEERGHGTLAARLRALLEENPCRGGTS